MMKYHSLFKSPSKGFSLIEVIIACAVLSITIGGVASFMGQTAKTKGKDRIRQTQQLLADRVKNLLNSPSHVLFSLTQHQSNPSIAHCLLGLREKSATPCKDLQDSKKPQPFGLFQVSGSDGKKGELISDPEKGSSVYYDIDGNKCTKLENLCIFSIKTRFFVQCETKDRTCVTGPKQVLFDFVVTQEIAVSGFGKKLPPFPKTKESRKMSPMAVMDILGSHRYHQCGGSSSLDTIHHGFLVGHDAQGNPECECIYPLVKESETKDRLTGRMIPNCRLLKNDELGCQGQTSGGLLRGFLSPEDRKDSLCIERAAAFDCAAMPLGASCPKDSWITRMASTDCYFVCEFAPDGKPHTCDLNWKSPEPSGPGSLEDDYVYPDFVCPINELYCCQPAQYEEK